LTINVLYKRKNESHIESLSEAHRLAEEDTSKERILAEVSFQMWNTAKDMPQRMKEVFILRYRAGKPAKEVADLLKIKVSTVHDQTKKALQFMRESLPQTFWDYSEVLALFFFICYHHVTRK
jgi:RNA polymerase sigma factor (sigma-70 family)